MFCRLHSSHFCPCVYPWLYRHNPEHEQAWGDPALARKLWSSRATRLRDRGPA